MFQKVIKVREQAAADLGLNMPARSYQEHLDDFVTMLLRMAVTLSVAFFAVFLWGNFVFRLFAIPLHLAHLDNRIFLYAPGVCMYGSTHEDNLIIEARCWAMAAILVSVPLLLAVQVLRSERPGTVNFNSLK